MRREIEYQTLQEENRQIQQQLDNIKNESIEEEWKRQEEIQEVREIESWWIEITTTRRENEDTAISTTYN